MLVVCRTDTERLIISLVVSSATRLVERTQREAECHFTRVAIVSSHNAGSLFGAFDSHSPADCVAGARAAGNTLAVGMWRKKAQTIAEISPSNASPYRPPEKLPVKSFITPTYQGPKKPPRLPIELIHGWRQRQPCQ